MIPYPTAEYREWDDAPPAVDEVGEWKRFRARAIGFLATLVMVVLCTMVYVLGGDANNIQPLPQIPAAGP